MRVIPAFEHCGEGAALVGLAPTEPRRLENEFGKSFTLDELRAMYADARRRFPDFYRYEFASEAIEAAPIAVACSAKASVHLEGRPRWRTAFR